MRFTATDFPGMWVIDLELRKDERGFLARTYCDAEFGARGLVTQWPQCNLTCSKTRGMVRGLHFQAEPKGEAKLIRCTTGAVFDVAVDIRRGSPTFGKWQAFELTAENRRMVYIPTGFAHGIQCLADGSEVFYQMSESYAPELARGVRWDDPDIGVAWPLANATVSDRDARMPLLRDLA